MAAIITIFSNGALYFFKLDNNLIADKYGTGSFPNTLTSLIFWSFIAIVSLNLLCNFGNKNVFLLKELIVFLI
jgi:hypothetical protein